MSFGGNQGTLRYALILDDTQSTQKLNQFKTGLTALTSPTQAVNREMGVLSNNFKGVSGNLTRNNTLIGQAATQSKTLGTQVKDVASKYSTFAIGLGATVAQVVNLGRQFRDLEDTQIAVDRTTRKLSLANEAVDKTTAKVNQLIKEGKKGTVEYSNAVRDQSQALAQASIATDLNAEALEAQGDTYTNFAVSVVPAVITAIGTVGSSFKDLASKGSSLKNMFTGIGTAFSGIIPSITGIGKQAPIAATGITAVGTASTVTAGAVTRLKGALATLAIPLGIIGAVVGGGLFAAGQIQQQLIKSNQDWIKVIETNQKRQLDFLKTLGLNEDQMKSLHGVIKALNDIFGVHTISVDKLNQSGTQSIKWIAATSDEQNKLNDVMFEATRIFGPMASMIGDIGKEYQQTIGPAQNYVKQLVAERIERVQNLASLHEYSRLHGITIPANIRGNVEEIKKLISQYVFEKDAIDKVTLARQKEINLLKANAQAYTEAQIVRQRTIEVAQKEIDMRNQAAAAIKTEAEAITQRAVAVAKLRQQIEQEVQKLQAKRFDLLGIFDIKSPQEQRDKILKQLVKMLPNKVEKKVEMELEFSSKVDATKEAFQVFLGQALVMDDKRADSIAKTTIDLIDKKFKGIKGPFVNLRTQLEAAIADPNTPDKLRLLLLQYDWTTLGGNISSNIQTGMDKKPITPKVSFAKKGGDLSSDGFKLFGGTADDPFGLKKAAEKTKVTIPAPITTQYDSGIKAAQDKITGSSGLVKTIENAKPSLTILNTAALKSIGVVVKNFDKMVDMINKARPKITIQNTEALKAIGAVVRNMENIPNVTRTVTIKTNTVNAQGGFQSSSLPEDTAIFAHKGESVRIGSGMGGSIGSGNGGGGRLGDINLDVHVHTFDTEIERKFKARQGVGRYRFGA